MIKRLAKTSWLVVSRTWQRPDPKLSIKASPEPQNTWNVCVHRLNSIHPDYLIDFDMQNWWSATFKVVFSANFTAVLLMTLQCSINRIFCSDTGNIKEKTAVFHMIQAENSEALNNHNQLLIRWAIVRLKVLFENRIHTGIRYNKHFLSWQSWLFTHQPGVPARSALLVVSLMHLLPSALHWESFYLLRLWIL